MNVKHPDARHGLVMPRENCAQLASAWDTVQGNDGVNALIHRLPGIAL